MKKMKKVSKEAVVKDGDTAEAITQCLMNRNCGTQGLSVSLLHCFCYAKCFYSASPILEEGVTNR